jgi:ribA/ribD-fused uncharacterized protein
MFSVMNDLRYPLRNRVTSTPINPIHIPETQASNGSLYITYDESVCTIPATLTFEDETSPTPQVNVNVTEQKDSHSSFNESSSALQNALNYTSELSSHFSTSPLLPFRSSVTPDDSSLLVTPGMIPPDDVNSIHEKTVRELILANKQIEEMRNEICELKAKLITENAVHSVEQLQVEKPQVQKQVVTQELLLFRASGRLGILSNFHECNLTLNGLKFKSVEHAYQYQKAIFHDRKDIATRVLHATSPYLAKQAAKSIAQTEDWHKCKIDVMTDILSQKAKQNINFCKVLMNTGNKHLVHNTENDSFWGCGENFQGLNKLGTILEDLRMTLHLALPNSTSSKHVIQKEKASMINSNDIQSASDTIPPVIPTVKRPKVLVLGNSNSRGVAQELIDRGLDASGFTIPGCTVSHLTTRIRHLAQPQETHPDFIVLMVGDIEAADGLPVDAICARYEHLLKEVRHNFPWIRIVLTGLPQAGNNVRQDILTKVNNYLEAVASEERLIEFVCNARAKLRDHIHMSNSSKIKLCLSISNTVKKLFM